MSIRMWKYCGWKEKKKMVARNWSKFKTVRTGSHFDLRDYIVADHWNYVKKCSFSPFLKISSSKTTFFHIFTIFYYGIKQEIKYITIILVPNYNNLWNSAANTIISSLEWYLGFCSVNLVLGHFHDVYYELLVVHIYLLSTKTILYNIRS